ncbi:hypothetical protein SCHPADRAFT_48361 [Schizopora paradoxa]|uniref:F-box domain-containing protein n=1 Tax=Schizopora paradoxa TaxID=27342 RepID=A0A0H2SS85_9AGAM|nr:hypothetical protein SCHPADRAFT_48361 [Schizopora paradoxa]
MMLPEILANVIRFVITRGEDVERAGWLELGLGGRIRPCIMTARDTPWPYMFVCKTWYDALLSTPHLWTTFFAICDGRHPDVPRIASMFDHCLRRSVNEPLTLYICSSFRNWKEADAKNHTIVFNMIKRAYEQKHRWEDVRLSFHCQRFEAPDEEPAGQAPAPIEFNLQLKDTTMLKKLGIDISGTERFASNPRRGRQLALMPSHHLQLLRIQNKDTNILLPSGSGKPLHFPNLHTLDLDFALNGTHDQLWALLAASPNVVSLKLRLSFIPPHGPTSITPNTSTLPFFKLHDLAIQANSTIQLSALLDRWDFPSLKKLKLLWFSLSNESLSEMTRVFTMHPHSIDSLLLDIIRIPQAESLEISALKTFFRSFSELEHLQVDSVVRYYIPDSFFRAFTKMISRPDAGEDDQVGTDVLPRLKTLVLTASSANILVGDRSPGVIKNVILACKQRYPADFHIKVQQDDYAPSMCGELQLEEVAVRSLLEDMDVRRCVSEDFSVYVQVKKDEFQTWMDSPR